MARTTIEPQAWTDARFATLARLLGFADADHAIIRTARLWSWQTEHYTPEAPTYVVDVDTIESTLGAVGAAPALVRARLAEETPDGYRIRGTIGRIEWLWGKRQSSKAGGEATRRKHAHRERPLGPPIGLPHGQPGSAPIGSDSDPDCRTGPVGLPSGQPAGAPVGQPDGRPSLSPEEECAPARVRAIPPSTEQAPAPVPAVPITPAAIRHAERRRKLIFDAWAIAGREFRALQAEGLDPEAMNAWAGMPSASSPPMKNLIAIIDELLVGEPPDYERASTVIERRVLVAAAEARTKHRHLQYMTPSRIWNPDSFAIASELTPGQVAQEPRAGPRGSAARAPEQPPPRRMTTLKT